MSHSNRGLNEPFYKWIDDVRRALRKEKELQEKLEFYNMKLIGYKGVSYDRIGSSGTRSSGDSELLFWLDKIVYIEKNIENNQKLLKRAKDFYHSLDHINRMTFLFLLHETRLIDFMHLINMSRSRVYKIIDAISIKWKNYE